MTEINYKDQGIETSQALILVFLWRILLIVNEAVGCNNSDWMKLYGLFFQAKKIGHYKQVAVRWGTAVLSSPRLQKKQTKQKLENPCP